MSSDPQLLLFSCVDDVLLRTLYHLIRLFIVEFYEVQYEQETVVGYFTRPYSHLPWGFEEYHEGPHSGDNCSGWGSERKSKTLQLEPTCSAVAWTGPDGSQISRRSAHDGGKVSPTHQPP
jgi:hypothetical protein